MSYNKQIMNTRGNRIIRNCEYILEDGHKCNCSFTSKMYNGGQTRFCPEHQGLRNGEDSRLRKGANMYMKNRNTKEARDWVFEKMANESAETKRLAGHERDIKELQMAVKNLTTMNQNLLELLSITNDRLDELC